MVLDGELLGMTPVYAKVLPASLKVLVPQAVSESDLVKTLAKAEGLEESVAELVVKELGADAPAAIAGLAAEKAAEEVVSSRLEDSLDVEDHPIVKK